MNRDPGIDLAPTGTIRAAINIGNPTLARVEADGSLAGRSVELAKAIGDRLGRPVTFQRYDSAGSVVEAAKSGAWDVAFLAVDPARAATLHFTSPYLVIETTYAVPKDSPLQAVADIDRAGTRIASSKGSAYDLHLRRVVRDAELISCETPLASFALLVAGGAECAAGVRQALDRFFADKPGFRVLAGNLATVGQAIVTPRDRRAAAEFLDRFVAELPAATSGESAMRTGD